MSAEQKAACDSLGIVVADQQLGPYKTQNSTSKATKVQLGYIYQDADVKNIQMGGIRVGSFRDQHIYGNGPMVRVTHKLTQNLSADLMVLQLKYTSDVTNMNSRIGLSYDFASNLHGRFDFNSIDRSGYSSNRWAFGFGYRF